MVAALTLGSTALFAQKFGRIDYQGVLFLMPEIATVQTNIQKVQADYQEHIEGMVVELNKKRDEIANLPETTSTTSRQLKQREADELEQRVREYYNVAEQGIQQAEAESIRPLKIKLDAAVKKVCKEQGIVAVFQTTDPNVLQALQVVYVDEDTAIDINAAVRAELGIAADAVATPMQ